MRCWHCKRLLLVPEREIPNTDKYSQTACVEVECNCGARYSITTSRLPKSTRPIRHIDEATVEEERGWK